MQLVAYGAQDIYLTGNPQITFFKVVYRRHTNFSMETIQQTINGASITAGGNGTVTISRNGDLVTSVYVTSNTAGIYDGSSIVSQVDCEIGGQMIDRQYQEWNNIWNDLTVPASKRDGFAGMTNSGSHGSKSGGNGPGLVQIPLNFWFCRNPGLALPLIALQYHEVKLKFKWGTANDVGRASLHGGTALEATCQVWVDYIYLDTDERRRFAQVSHEYLIEQIQKQSAAATTSNKLNFNHPVKEIIWTSAEVNTYGNAKLILNGHDRFAAQEEEYFQLRQPYQYHTSIPSLNLPEVSHVNDTAYQTLAQYTPAIVASGVIYTNNLTDTEKAVDAGVNGFSLSNADGATPSSGHKASTIVPLELIESGGVTAGKSVLVAHVDASVSIVPNVVLTSVSATKETGILSFADSIVQTSVVSAVADALSIIIVPNLTHLDDGFKNSVTCLAIRIGIGFDTDLVTTETANDGAANGFTSCSPDGSAKATAATDGKQVIVGADIAGISVGDRHYIIHTDASEAAEGKHKLGAGQRVTNTAKVVSFEGGLLKYDKQVTHKIATATSDTLAIFKFDYHSDISTFARKINVYSFALKPEEHQPSGTCNFSRIDSAKLNTHGALTATDNIYAVNYNVLRIMSGMGGLAYSN